MCIKIYHERSVSSEAFLCSVGRYSGRPTRCISYTTYLHKAQEKELLWVKKRETYNREKIIIYFCKK